jgi:Family of unknown function (DUF6599)
MNRKNIRIEKGETFKGRLILLVCVLMTISVYLTTIKITSAKSDYIQSIVTIPQSLKPLNSPEVFGPDNLYEKINGQAKLYLSAGFVHLKSQWFAEAENADSLFEVYIYHMGDGLNAFSVYSTQRVDDAHKVDLVPFAYQTENSLYLVHGPYYVEMISATLSENILPKMTLLAQNFIKETPVDKKSIEELRFFPKENLNKGSMSLIAKNAFGFDGLDRVFTATYSIDGGKITAFISKQKNSQEAKNLAIGFHKYFITFGGKDIKPDVVIKDAKMVEIMDTFEIMFSLNSYLAGVHEASTKIQAEAMAEVLASKLQEALGTK